MFFVFALLSFASSQSTQLIIFGPCTPAVELSITGSLTNSSGVCSLGPCSFDAATNQFGPCTANFDFQNSGETVVAVHLIWKAFSFQGVQIIPGRVLFPVIPDTQSGSATIPAGPAPQNLSLALQQNPLLSGEILLTNRFFFQIYGLS